MTLELPAKTVLLPASEPPEQGLGQVMGSGIAVEGPQAVGSTHRLAMVLAETSSMRGCDRGLREEHRSLGRR